MSYLNELLQLASEKDASDLHLQPGQHPWIRVDGALKQLATERLLEASDLDPLLAGVLTKDEKSRLEDRNSLEFSFRDEQLVSWRGTYFRQRRGMSGAFRRLSRKPPSLAELNLPSTLERLAHYRSGLILFTGASGSGKSTTLAAVVERINQLYTKQIITLEDPIEYYYEPVRCVFQQRGLHLHFDSYPQGLLDARREGPDVLVLGELRSYETIHQALKAAESGMLVFSTLHTLDAPRAIDRIIDVFPANAQGLACSMLAQALRAVISQVLLPRKKGSGRLPVCEILFNTPGVASLIREGKVHELPSAIQTGGKLGMVTMDANLKRLHEAGEISAEEAYSVARDKGAFEPYL